MPDDIYIIEGLQPKPETPEAAMVKQQKYNLDLLEKWAGSMPLISGVPVVKAFTYDLIQIVNRLGMVGNE